MFTRSRLHGGVVTQRIANPLPRLENKAKNLEKMAQMGVSGGSVCKNAFSAILCGLALSVTACGERPAAPCPAISPPVDAAPELAGGRQFRSRCIVLKGGGSWECYPEEARAILQICGLGNNPGCEAEARAAVDAISLKRARDGGAAALLDIHDAAVSDRAER